MDTQFKILHKDDIDGSMKRTFNRVVEKIY